jgi:hypothetical protein
VSLESLLAKMLPFLLGEANIKCTSVAQMPLLLGTCVHERDKDHLPRCSYCDGPASSDGGLESPGLHKIQIPSLFSLGPFGTIPP